MADESRGGGAAADAPDGRSPATRRRWSGTTRVPGGREMVVEVTQAPQGIAISINGARSPSAAVGGGLDVPTGESL